MHTNPDAPERLRTLERILTSPTTGDSRDRHADPTALHVRAVPSERIRRVTAALQLAPTGPLDDVDRVSMRVLLNDYTAAVAHLRAAAQAAANIVDTTAQIVGRAERVLEKEARRRAKLALRPT